MTAPAIVNARDDLLGTLDSLLAATLDIETKLRAMQQLVRSAPLHSLSSPVQIKDIVRLAAAHYRVPPSHLYLPSRRQSVVLPRQLAMFLARRAGFSTTAIADHFGKDHGTVSFAEHQIAAQIDVYPELRRDIDRLLQTITNNSNPAAPAASSRL